MQDMTIAEKYQALDNKSEVSNLLKVHRYTVLLALQGVGKKSTIKMVEAAVSELYNKESQRVDFAIEKVVAAVTEK